MTLLLPPIAQAAALLIMVAGAAALVVLGLGRIGANRQIAERDAAMVRIETANADLQDDIDRLRDKLATATREQNEAEARSSHAASEAAALRGLLASTQSKLHAVQSAAAAAAAAPAAAEPGNDRAAQMAKTLDETRLALHQAAAEGATLSARLSKAEADQAQERAQYEAAAKQLQSVIGQLEQELLHRSLGSRKLAQSAPAPTNGVADLGRRGLGAVERVLASTGVDVARLFSRFGIDRAEGGPFVPPPKPGAEPPPPTPQQLAARRKLMQSLPLGTPVAHYQIGSPFGTRTDPFNHRPAMHTGIDFDAAYMSPVYATAAGTIVETGYRRQYGKIVEIDHGDGIHTLYAHLHRAAVSVGEKVAAGTQIGWVGTTGRSSGPHVHYEVLVNGEPQDPEKFIGLARLVPAAAGEVSRTAGARSENSR